MGHSAMLLLQAVMVLVGVVPTMCDRDGATVTGNANAIGCWDFSSASDGNVPNSCGDAGAGRFDPAGAAAVDLGPDANHTGALQLFGNMSGGGSPFTVPHSSELDKLDEFTLSFWIDWWWVDPSLDDTKVCTMGSLISALELYNGFLKYEVKGDEATPYPARCGYIEPGKWQYVTISHRKSHLLDYGGSSVALYVDGAVCPVSPPPTTTAATAAAASTSQHEAGAVRTTTTPGPRDVGELESSHVDLNFGSWAGLLADVRLWSGPLDDAAVAVLYNSSAALYASAAVRFPTPSVVAQAGRGWKPAATPATAGGMRRAWLNGSDADVVPLRWVDLIVWPGADATPHPAARTASAELKTLLPWAKLTLMSDWATPRGAASRAAAVVVCTCNEHDAIADLVEPEQLCPLAGSVGGGTTNFGDSSFALRFLNTTTGPVLLVVGGAAPGMLYGAFAVVRHVRLRLPITAGALDTTQTPATKVRLLNHWSNWRGLPQDDWADPPGNRSAPPPGGGGGAFCDGADREDSLFSWADLADPSNSTALATITSWARLLASVGINALAPQDVNWFEPNNYLEHLPELAVLGSVLRGFAIRIFWTPNFEIAPQPEVADAIYAAVPDFGGYLLKVGSESQGGLATPENINGIAALLVRNRSNETSGAVFVRGFIYGSKYGKANRESVPAAFFGSYDGEYASNVYILGKYTALDYETSAPINALDGLMQKTNYGPDVEVGKGFLMSWATRWAGWLNANNWRGAGNTGLLNRAVTQGFLGVIIIGNGPGWTTNPLNMVNVYAFGRLSWDTTATAADIHREWAKRTFGADSPAVSSPGNVISILELSLSAADLLGIYRGYRGIWYKFAGDSLRSKPVNEQMVGSGGIGMPGKESGELLKLYAPKLQAIYGNTSDPRTQAGLLEFGCYKPSHMLPSGISLLDDMKQRPVAGLNATLQMVSLWQQLKGSVDARYWAVTATEMALFVQQAQLQNARLQTALAKL